MKKNIVQFVCFETNLEFDKFMPNWEHYAKKFESKEVKTNLLEQVNAKSKFKYVSQHIAPKDELQFTFMKEKRSVILPESKIKVVQAGGYKPVQVESNQTHEEMTRVILFLSKSLYDVSPYKVMDYQALNIYEAYFESCNYSYILEFFITDASGENLMNELKGLLHNPEIGIYKESLVLEG